MAPNIIGSNLSEYFYRAPVQHNVSSGNLAKVQRPLFGVKIEEIVDKIEEIVDVDAASGLVRMREARTTETKLLRRSRISALKKSVPKRKYRLSVYASMTRSRKPCQNRLFETTTK